VLLDVVNRVDPTAGPRVAIGMGVVFLALCALALTRVDPTRREDGGGLSVAEPGGAPHGP
jgi:hypothetical protein